MRRQQSHVWEPWAIAASWGVALALGIAALWTWGGAGAGVSRQALMEEASRQSRVLTERTRDRVESIRAQALAFFELDRKQRLPSLPSGDTAVILHWSRWNPETHLLESAASQDRLSKLADAEWGAIGQEIPWQSVRESGASVLFQRGRATFLFRARDNAVVAAVVDPAVVFPLSNRDWKSIEPGGAPVRSFLVAKGGQVISHSLRGRKTLDFSKTPIYVEALEDALGGGRPGGSGRYLSVDHVRVDAAYERIEPYELVAVSEVQESRAQDLGSRWKSRAKAALEFALALAAASLAALLTSRRKSAGPKSAPDPAPVEAVSPQEFDRVLRQQARQELRSSDTLILSEVREPERIYHARPQPEPPAGAWSARRGIDAQMVETALFQELRTPTRQAREEKERRVRIARLEAELAELAAFPEDEQVSRLLAERLAEFVAKTLQAPALYFRVHAESQRVILDAVEGLDAFDQDLIQGGLAFPLLPVTAAKARNAAARGSIFPMTEDSALAALMRVQFQGRPYQAWAIQGTGKGEVFGVLVALIAGPRNEGEADTLARLIRSMGRLYENGTLLADQ